MPMLGGTFNLRRKLKLQRVNIQRGIIFKINCEDDRYQKRWKSISKHILC